MVQVDPGLSQFSKYNQIPSHLVRLPSLPNLVLPLQTSAVFLGLAPGGPHGTCCLPSARHTITSHFRLPPYSPSSSSKSSLPLSRSDFPSLLAMCFNDACPRHNGLYACSTRSIRMLQSSKDIAAFWPKTLKKEPPFRRVSHNLHHVFG